MTGCTNINEGKRTQFHKCEYWKRDNNDTISLDILVHEKKADGRFSARQENNRTNDANIVAGLFMFDNESITLSTTDIVNIIKNDVVKFENQYWNVINVQFVERHKNSEFMTRNVSKRTYIQLRR